MCSWLAWHPVPEKGFKPIGKYPETDMEGKHASGSAPFKRSFSGTPRAIGPRNVSQDVPGHRIYPIGRNPISRKRIPNDTGEVVRIPPCRQRIIDRYQISCRVEEIREIPLSLS